MSAGEPHPRILLVTGSTRGGSTNTAALRSVADPGGRAVTELFEGLADIPAFNPDDDRDPLPVNVEALRRQIGSAAGVLFCSPEYAGALPGSFKNLLDWMVGGGELYGKPVAWINVAGPGRGAGADRSLAVVLGYLGAEVVEAACRHIVVPRDAVGADGLIQDETLRADLADAMRAFVDHIASGSDADPGGSS
jgi:chromate reductase, NAD(P)H dehydrogenase (quinone)